MPIITHLDTDGTLPIEYRIHVAGPDLEIREVEIWIDGILRSDDNDFASFTPASQLALQAAVDAHEHAARQRSRQLMLIADARGGAL